MKSTFILGSVLALLSQAPAVAQSTKLQALEQKILQEGLALYESERASWVATDLLMAQKPDMTGMIGYLSYADEDSVRTVFFQQTADQESFTARYSFSFPRTAIQPATGRRFAARPASAREQMLFTQRLQVMEELESGRVAGKPYLFPKNTRPNVVLLEQPAGTRAYVLAGPQEGGVLPIGNDLLMSFSTAGKLTKVERLHNSYLAMRMPEDGTTVEGGMHTHLPAHPYITPTDICSLLLYAEAFPAPQHYVMGSDYVSVFNIPQRRLTLLTKKAFDKMYDSK
ncbi:hypothetical protein [Hymenobacter canadensis]|uniref:Uncharacterized protein n=1 Tax=Hymenobacter canadensis TaxID=2999067 RepID=A0ABY7LSH2_9BACT|nr:hypothetical protein [Hymenobacter canadensis]WBA43339.1 hypothetical protein O3303_07165 [Hymenobacter canadensis]